MKITKKNLKKLIERELERNDQVSIDIKVDIPGVEAKREANIITVRYKGKEMRGRIQSYSSKINYEELTDPNDPNKKNYDKAIQSALRAAGYPTKGKEEATKKKNTTVFAPTSDNPRTPYMGLSKESKKDNLTKIIEKLILEETSKVLEQRSEDRTSTREHWQSGGLENGIEANETAAFQFESQSPLMAAQIKLGAATQWFDWLKRLGIKPEEEGQLRNEEPAGERYRHYSKIYLESMKVIKNYASALGLARRLNKPQDDNAVNRANLAGQRAARAASQRESKQNNLTKIIEQEVESLLAEQESGVNLPGVQFANPNTTPKNVPGLESGLDYISGIVNSIETKVDDIMDKLNQMSEPRPPMSDPDQPPAPAMGPMQEITKIIEQEVKALLSK